MAATNLIPWAPVESDQRWQEAPTYQRDEFLTQWETANTERAAGDTAIIDRIKEHAASIRAELYGQDSKAGVPAAVSELQGVVDAQSPEEKRKSMFGRIKAASAAREPERIAEQTELDSKALSVFRKTGRKRRKRRGVANGAHGHVIVERVP